MRIDLHTHSTASDGTDTPAQLVANAALAGLDVLALTDHDTTAGWDEAAAARPDGLTIVLGTEFSCVYTPPTGRRINLHLLGYLFDRDDAQLKAERVRLRDSRLHRAEAIVANLVADGHPISWPQVEAIADGGAVGRPHIARALIAAGQVNSTDEAFAGVLHHRSKYYVSKANLDVFQAIGLLRGAGGLAVFAHPLAHQRGPIVDDDAIAAMAEAGLVGIEIDHPDHDGAARAHAAGLARELNLVGTGSSDYHGTNKTRNELGVCTTTPEAYEQLLALDAAASPLR